MPIYEYNCPIHGAFESIESVSNRERVPCTSDGCQMICDPVISVNKDMAKTKYTLPPKATRKFGDPNVTPYNRKKWV